MNRMIEAAKYKHTAKIAAVVDFGGNTRFYKCGIVFCKLSIHFGFPDSPHQPIIIEQPRYSFTIKSTLKTRSTNLENN